MSHGILKQIILFSSTLLLVLSFVAFTAPAHTAAASKAATHYCLHKTPQAVCEQAFDDGVPGGSRKSVQDACSAYPANSNNLAVCQSAWGAASSEDPAVYGGGNQSDFIGKYINPAIDLFSLSFGLVATISIILGGIQYSASEGDPQKATAAKSRISNTIIAIFAYLFLYAFLQFLIPGGAFQ
jgi:hypothetical protein